MVQAAGGSAAAEASAAAGSDAAEPGPHSGDVPQQQQQGGAAPSAAAMQHCVSEQVLDASVHFQIVDLGRQLYVWVGTGDARMGSMCVASPVPPGGHASLLCGATRNPRVAIPDQCDED